MGRQESTTNEKSKNQAIKVLKRYRHETTNDRLLTTDKFIKKELKIIRNIKKQLSYCTT